MTNAGAGALFDTVLTDALLADGSRVSIGITAGRIAAIDAVLPAGREQLSVGGSLVLPGLVDAHVHLAGGATTDGSIPGAADAEKTLRAGVTTVRDLGSTDNAGVALRGAIINGAVRGPRMIVAGAGIGAAGGACDQVFGQQGRIATPEDAVRVVDEQAAAHVDVIKICTGGGVLPRAADADIVELDEAMVRVIVEAARKHGLRVAAHAEGPRAIAAAIRGGAVSIEHGALVDVDNIADLKRHGTVLVPTLYRIDFTLAQLPDGPRKAVVAEGRALAFSRVRAAVAAGVPIAMGTDATVIPHGDNARELGALVEVGMTPAAAIRAATLDAAALVAPQLGIGEIAPARQADLIGVRGDPLADVAALRDVVFVMKDGAIVRE